MFKHVLLFALSAPVCALSWANATVPSKDLAGAQDNPLLKRYEGSSIVEYSVSAYDEITLPLSKLERVGDDVRDDMNNLRFAPTHKLELEGKLTRLVYVLPAGRSPLEVLRNYQDEIRTAGGSIEFECKTDECGGDIDSGSDHGGGHGGILEQIFPRQAISSPNFSNGNCAINSRHADQRFFVAQLGSAVNAQVAVMTYTLRDDLYCKALNERTVAIVVLLEAKAREQKMLAVNASELSQSLAQTGRIALYGILFDFDKADIKPESRAQLDEIAALLKADATLNLTVAGHTDNQGGLGYNLELSKRRADAVVAALTAQYGISAARLAAQGIGSTAPVAPNDTEEGRARNRRVELLRKL